MVKAMVYLDSSYVAYALRVSIMSTIWNSAYRVKMMSCDKGAKKIQFILLSSIQIINTCDTIRSYRIIEKGTGVKCNCGNQNIQNVPQHDLEQSQQKQKTSQALGFPCAISTSNNRVVVVKLLLAINQTVQERCEKTYGAIYLQNSWLKLGNNKTEEIRY